MICIIPARGGSTRLPGKNIKPLFGRPVIHWTIDICKSSGLFSDVIVSTDSDEIAEVARAGGANIFMRPERLSGDVSESAVLKYTAEVCNSFNLCRVYPFAALLTPERLRQGEYFHAEYQQTIIEAVQYKHPIQRAFDLRSDYIEPYHAMTRTQDLPPRFHDAATFMFTTLDHLAKPMYIRNTQALAVGQFECQDVDDAEDFEMLKLKFAYKNYGGSSE